MRKLVAIVLLATGAALAAGIPSGTTIKVRTTSPISSATVKSGDHWNGTLDSDVKDSDGNVIARKGDAVNGIVQQSRPSGRLSDPGFLSLGLESIAGHPVSTDNYTTEAGSHKKRNAAAIGGAAALGAIIGAAAGGGKGAAIGAGAGAGAGTVGAAATGKKDVTIPSETVLKFRVTQ